MPKNNYVEVNVTLTDIQKKKLAKCAMDKKPCIVQLKKNQLNGPDNLYLTPQLARKLQKAIDKQTGVKLNMSSSLMKYNVKSGGSFMKILTKAAPMLLASVAGPILENITSGLFGKKDQQQPQGRGLYPFGALPAQPVHQGRVVRGGCCQCGQKGGLSKIAPERAIPRPKMVRKKDLPNEIMMGAPIPNGQGLYPFGGEGMYPFGGQGLYPF